MSNRITYILEFNNDNPRLPTAALEQVAEQYGGATLSYHQGDVAAGLHPPPQPPPTRTPPTTSPPSRDNQSTPAVT